MLQNYYTLRLIASDLDSAFRGHRIESIFSQSKNELVWSVDSGATLIISCEPSANFMYLRPPFPRAKKNSLDFFSVVRGSAIKSVFIQPSDREVLIDCDGKYLVIIRLFGSKANVFLTDAKRTVLDSFLHPADLKGSSLSPPARPSAFPQTLEEFKTQFRSIGHLSALSVLKRLVPLYGSLVLRELLFRIDLSEQATVAEVSDQALDRLFRATREIGDELLHHARPRLYEDNGVPVALSILELRHLSRYNVREMDSINEAVRAFVGATFKRRSFLRERESVISKMVREKERAERTLANMTAEDAQLEQAVAYERFGKIVLANLGQLHKGMTSAVLPDVLSPSGGTIAIPLDPHLTPTRNAERYFEKAKRIRGNQEELAGRKEELHRHYELLRTLLEKAELLQTHDRWREFLESNLEQLERIGVISRKKASEIQERIPFRAFVVDGGFQVWAGKNSANNDLLTMKHARQNDLWFHARGGSGSHVVLRAGTGKGEVSKKAIREAASIAAYYSKLKHSRLVPVAMTLRKYVRKPRGAPPGTVTIEREDVLMVEPRLPSAARE